MPQEDQLESFAELSFPKLSSSVIEMVRKYLSKYIEKVNEEKKERINEYVQNVAVEYRPIVKHNPEMLEKISPDVSDKALEIELHKAKTTLEIKTKEEVQKIALEVGAEKKPLEIEERPPVEIIKEEPKIEAPKAIGVVTEGSPKKIKEELGIIPTPLPKGAKVIYSTDVVSGVKTEKVQGKVRIIITLSGERKYTVSETGRPPAIIIDIPHTINAVSPGRIMVNQGEVRTIEVSQHRAVPFDETRIIIRLSRFKEYEIKSKDNEIHVEFEE